MTNDNNKPKNANGGKNNNGGGNQGGGGCQNRGGKPKRNKKDNNKHGKSSAKFKGKCKDLEGVIFDANRFNQADEYIKSVREIAEYVGTNYDYGADIRRSIEEGRPADIPRPPQPPPSGDGAIDPVEEMIWKKELECYVKRKVALSENLRKAYSLVWGQCSDVMREKLEALSEFKAIRESDC